jgi:hypothetical protein
MRRPAWALIILFRALALSMVATVDAQAQPPQTSPPATQGRTSTSTPLGQESEPPRRPIGPARKRLEPYLSLTSVFDTNIDHDTRDVDSAGGVLGAGIVYRNSPVDPTVEINAEVAGHSYTNSSRWDRFSQKLNASWEYDLPGRWRFDTTGEISLKGSTEDRELSDQYVIIPRVAYRITSQTRVRVYGALRARRYDDDRDRNAFNRYVGVEFTERAAPDRRWEADLRYEVNETESPRQHYVRWTFGTEYSFLVADADRVNVEARYRMQRYPFRLVEVDDTDVQRRDHRWIPRISWTRPLRSDLDLRAGYILETRTSNDLNREFTAHLFTVTVIRRW